MKKSVICLGRYIGWTETDEKKGSVVRLTDSDDITYIADIGDSIKDLNTKLFGDWVEQKGELK